MTNSGEEVLLELFNIIEKYKKHLTNKTEEEIAQGLLVLHRVCIVMLDVHERNMLDCGLTKDDILENKKILEAARTLPDPDDIACTMPKGEA